MHLARNYLAPRRIDTATRRNRQNLPGTAAPDFRLIADRDAASAALIVAYQLPG